MSESPVSVLARQVAKLKRDNARMLDACKAVIGNGYLECKHPAGQDYVCKTAIEKVKAAIRKATE